MTKFSMLSLAAAVAMAASTAPTFAASSLTQITTNIPTDYSVTMSEKSSPRFSSKTFDQSCSQLERSIGIKGADCGFLSAQELAKLANLQDQD